MVSKNKVWRVIKSLLSVIFFVVLFLFSFVSTPSLLQVFSTFLLVMTIGSILDAKRTLGARILKIILYIIYLLYSLYTLGIFYNIGDIIGLFNFRELNQEKIFKFMFGFVAPLCMLFVGKKLSNIMIRGRKVFQFYTVWGLYLLIAFIWDLFYPSEVIIEYLFAFWILSLLTIGYYKLSKGGTAHE